MHNSQNGGQVARGGSGVGWNDGGQLTGGSLQGPMNKLLVSSCVGCHTSTTSSTIINLGSNKIPIVYNTVQPVNPLAGGNFYWVAQGAANDGYGHNVYGIAAQDSSLTEAPGRQPSGCAGSCHSTLAAAPGALNYSRGGCEGCHVFTYHHENNGVYRFLKGHGIAPPISLTPERKNITAYPDYVQGVEDDDWEQETATDHNWYKGTDNSYSSASTGLTNNKTISSFCSGCHSVFHGPYEPLDGTGMGSASPWLRHPTDILLPNTGEYSGYDPVNNYSVEAPVAWLNPSAPDRAGAVVMCLSCHRAHGSEHPDLLRWDYSIMLTGGGGSGGCFTCHTNKN